MITSRDVGVVGRLDAVHVQDGELIFANGTIAAGDSPDPMQLRMNRGANNVPPG
jgi:hypothetical protein